MTRSLHFQLLELAKIRKGTVFKQNRVAEENDKVISEEHNVRKK